MIEASKVLTITSEEFKKPDDDSLQTLSSTSCSKNTIDGWTKNFICGVKLMVMGVMGVPDEDSSEIDGQLNSGTIDNFRMRCNRMTSGVCEPYCTEQGYKKSHCEHNYCRCTM
ncbi:hypothetical protein HCN44_009210 [Aphidius gifuensis]|uniref:Uncharacterized protein n=1 Tax=Aphidius gifuensis TaxID=684658 RepID=A0A834Y4R7_APHGI|nr:hypothetical protein HCN44_009210 [Aphidius gifuensis]